MNGHFKRFSQVYDKLIAVMNLKSISFWGINLGEKIQTTKLCNIMPFT